MELLPVRESKKERAAYEEQLNEGEESSLAFGVRREEKHDALEDIA